MAHMLHNAAPGCALDSTFVVRGMINRYGMCTSGVDEQVKRRQDEYQALHHGALQRLQHWKIYWAQQQGANHSQLSVTVSKVTLLKISVLDHCMCHQDDSAHKDDTKRVLFSNAAT